MSDRSPDGPRPGGWVAPPADATRDIRLPALPDRPAPAVRTEWAPYVPAAEQQPPAPPAPKPPPPAVDQPTDRMAPPQDRSRSATLSFQPPPPVQLLKVSVGPSRRSSRMWAVLIMVPLLVIVGAGIWLFVLLYG